MNAIMPALTVLVCLAFAAQLFIQYRDRRGTHQLAWALALSFYAVAAFPEAIGAIDGWNAPSFRVYYLFGAVLLVPWLSLGTSELLLAPGRTVDGARPAVMRTLYRGFVVAISLLGFVSVMVAALHAGHLVTTNVPSNCAMWCKSEPGYGLPNGLAALSAAVGNSVGTVVLVLGAGYSAYRTYRASLPVSLTAGNVLIVVGSIIVAGAATLTRLGSYQLFYAGQLAGIAVIYAGFLVIGSAAGQRARVAVAR